MRRTNNPDKQCKYKACKYRRMKRRKYCEKHVNMVEIEGTAQSVVPVIQEAYTKETLMQGNFSNIQQKPSLLKRIKRFIIMEA